MKVFRGRIVHCVRPDSVTILDDAVIGVQSNGKILFIEEDSASIEAAMKEFGLKEWDIERLEPSQFLMPGFVDTHIHAAQYQFAGTGYDLQLSDWLKTYTFPTEAKFSDVAIAREVYPRVVDRTLRNGTTTASYFATIHLDATTELCKIITGFGQRALVGKVNMDIESPDNNYYESTESSISDTLKFVNFVQKKLKNPLIEPVITPRFLPSCSEELLKELAKISREKGLCIQSFLCEQLDQITDTLSSPQFSLSYYKNCTQIFENMGLLTEKTYMVHCIHLEEEEMQLMKDRNVGIAHCPNSNFCLKSGLMDTRDRLQRGIKTGLGTNVSGGFSPSMLDAIRHAMQASRAFHMKLKERGQKKGIVDYKPITLDEALYMATIGGAKVLSLDKKIGNFEVGKEFDALLIDVKAVAGSGQLPVFDVFSRDSFKDRLSKFIYLGDDRNIVKVFVSGKEVVNKVSTDEANKKSDNDRVITQLRKEPVKEITSVGVGTQFNYIVPSMDNLECLSDVQVASKKLFLIQGDRSQMMNWERYGLRIGVSEGSLSFEETAEAAVVALVGGQFVFPDNTILVSAVYAVSLSRPLSKPLRLEIQHCVDLSSEVKPSCLKFAIAPVDIPSLPYQFTIVDGGEFKDDSLYGSINRCTFCLVCILGCTEKESTGGGNGEEEEDHNDESHEGEGEGGGKVDMETSGVAPSTPSSPLLVNVTDSYTDPVAVARGVNEVGMTDEHADTVIKMSSTEKHFCTKTASSTEIKKAMRYVGLVYYEEEGVEEVMKFFAVKKLDALIENIKEKNFQAKKGQHVFFSFEPNSTCIKLKFDAPKEKSFTGWQIEPHMDPCQLHRCDIDDFGEKDYSLPPSCLVSIYASSNAVSALYYSVPLVGIVDPVTLYIRKALRTIAPAPDLKSEAVLRKRKCANIESVASSLIEVLERKQAILYHAFVNSIKDIARELSQVDIISQPVRESPTCDAIIGEFKSVLQMKSTTDELENHCMNFLKALSNVRGPVAEAAHMLADEWMKETDLQIGHYTKRPKKE